MKRLEKLVRRRPWIADLGISLSVANLCFFRHWQLLTLPPSAKLKLYTSATAYPSTYLALPLGVSLLAALFFAGLRLSRHRTKASHAAHGIVAASLVLILPALEVVYAGFVIPSAVTMICAAAVFFTVAISVRARLGFRRAALLVLPFTGITFVQAFYRAATLPGPGAGMVYQSIGAPDKVLVLLFDELSQRPLFDSRPADLQLPSFDAFKRESVSLSRAYPPSGNTTFSLPALLTGRQVFSGEMHGDRELQIGYCDTPKERKSWAGEEDLFRRLDAIHVKSAVVGWFHPYCRLFGERLASCHHLSNLNGQIGFGKGILGDLAALTDELFLQLLPNFRGEIKVRALRESAAALRVAAEDPDIGFIFGHLPVPHPERVFDRKTGKVGGADSGGLDYYFDNLAYTDKYLGELRAELHRRGLWDSLTVIVTSDHWWRKGKDKFGSEDYRVPFLVKLPGGNRAEAFDLDIDTILLTPLVLDLFAGKVKDSSALLKWLASHRASLQKPCTYSHPG